MVADERIRRRLAAIIDADSGRLSRFMGADAEGALARLTHEPGVVTNDAGVVDLARLNRHLSMELIEFCNAV